MATTNVTNLIGTFKKVFSGVSEFRWVGKDVSTAELASLVWEKQLPVLTDGMDFSQADATVNSATVHGQSKPWASTATPGEVTMTISIPSIAEGVLEWLYTESAATLTTKEETINGRTGNFVGKGYALTKKVVTGTVMIISEDGSHALIVRHLVGYPSFEYSDPASKPFAVKLTCTLSGEVETDSVENDFDLAFLDWKDKSELLEK